eukprot:30550-Pelagococcus_subviridis.AAC.3
MYSPSSSRSGSSSPPRCCWLDDGDGSPVSSRPDARGRNGDALATIFGSDDGDGDDAVDERRADATTRAAVFDDVRVARDANGVVVVASIVAGRWCDSSGVLSACGSEVGTPCVPAHQQQHQLSISTTTLPGLSSGALRTEVFHPTLGFNI